VIGLGYKTSRLQIGLERNVFDDKDVDVEWKDRRIERCADVLFWWREKSRPRGNITAGAACAFKVATSVVRTTDLVVRDITSRPSEQIQYLICKRKWVFADNAMLRKLLLRVLP